MKTEMSKQWSEHLGKDQTSLITESAYCYLTVNIYFVEKLFCVTVMQISCSTVWELMATRFCTRKITFKTNDELKWCRANLKMK